MKRVTFAMGIGLASALLLGSNNADAFEYRIVSAGKLIVSNNGLAYTDVENTDGGKLRITTEAKLRIQVPHVITRLSQRLEILEPSLSSFSYTGRANIVYPEAEASPIANETETFHIAHGKLRTMAIGKCNDVAREMRARGRTNTEIFSQNRFTFFTMNARATFYTNSPANPTYTRSNFGNYAVEILCSRQATTARISNNPSTPFLVRSAHVDVKPLIRQSGPCFVNMQVSIRTNKPNHDFRYELADANPRSRPQFFNARTDNAGLFVRSHKLGARKVQSGNGRKGVYFVRNVISDQAEFVSNNAEYDFNCGSSAKKPILKVPTVPFKPVLKPQQLNKIPKTIPAN